MPSEAIKKFFIVLMLGSLTASAFFIRLENFKNSPNRSIDEIVYYRMGKQILTEGLSGYNTIPYARELTAQGRPLPDYFFQPVFKYPPLFSLLIAQSMRMFGETVVAAGYVSLLAGVLLIPLVYLLGALVGNRFVGALAAFLMFLDPVGVICSQKVWPETTLAFFTLISVVFFVTALKSRKDHFFVLSGVFCGLATVTKYPGIFPVIAYALYAAFRDRSLWTKPLFILGLGMPFLMMIPWAIWNFKIYGWDWVVIQVQTHSNALHREEMLRKTTLALLLGGIGLYWLFMCKGIKYVQEYFKRHKISLSVLLALALTVLLRENLWQGLSFSSLPSAGWTSGMFFYAPPLFYLGRLLEFSLLYGFGYATFFLPPKDVNEGVGAVKMNLIILMFFYILWGNYQSRYILNCIPLFLMLSAYTINLANHKLVQQAPSWHRNMLLLGLLLSVAYAIMKTNYINTHLAFSNDLCYF